MNKKIFVASIVGVLLLTSFNAKVNAKGIINKNTSLVEVETITQKDKEIEFIDGIYGVYGDYLQYDAIRVFKGKDDNHIDINSWFHKLGGFSISDLEIISNENGKIVATAELNQVSTYFDFIRDEELDLEDAKVDVILKDNEIEVQFNTNLKFAYAAFRNIKMRKVNFKCITEHEKQKAIKNILESNFKDINKDVFEVIHDTENYLVVRVKSFVYQEEGMFDKNYVVEGSWNIGMYKFYNIEKKTKKILELVDIIKNLDNLNEYIINSIETKRDKWIEEGRDNYQQFKGLGKNEYFEIDEDRNVVRISCLGYPDEAMRAIGSLCLDVPFSFFKLNGLVEKDIDILKDNLLFDAIKNDDLKKVKELIESGANVNAKDNYDRSTPLHEVRDAEIARLLIDNGANVNAKDIRGYTPLYICITDRLDIAKLLIENGADVNVKNEWGKTLLHDVKDTEIAKLLVNNGADVNAKDVYHGYTPLHLTENVDIAKLLIENGADINAKCDDGMTPLCLHVGRYPGLYESSPDISKLLIEKGADVNAKDNDGKTPLHWVQNTDIARLLIENGAQVNAKDNKGKTPLDIARECGDKDMIELLTSVK